MGKTSRRAAVVVFALGIALAGVLAGTAVPKSYHFTRVSIDATVLPDGSVQIVEHRTYDFSGDFHGADYTIRWPSDKIEGFTVQENGKELHADSNPFVS